MDFLQLDNCRGGLYAVCRVPPVHFVQAQVNFIQGTMRTTNCFDVCF